VRGFKPDDCFGDVSITAIVHARRAHCHEGSRRVWLDPDDRVGDDAVTERRCGRA
jgi:hypothetical protein